MLSQQTTPLKNLKKQQKHSSIKSSPTTINPQSTEEGPTPKPVLTSTYFQVSNHFINHLPFAAQSLITSEPIIY